MSEKLTEAVELSHYSKTPIVKVHSKTQEPGDGMKPRGLWFSVDDPNDDSPTWASWCETESYKIGPIRHLVTLAADARIRRISSVRELDTFHQEFKASIYPGGRREYIDWRAVAETCQGIIIAPYQWGRRLEGRAGWYYSWDVASGCVWDASAIASITPAGRLALEKSGGER